MISASRRPAGTGCPVRVSVWMSLSDTIPSSMAPSYSSTGRQVEVVFHNSNLTQVVRVFRFVYPAWYGTAGPPRRRPGETGGRPTQPGSTARGSRRDVRRIWPERANERDRTARRRGHRHLVPEFRQPGGDDPSHVRLDD